MVNVLYFINTEYGVRFLVHSFCFMGHGSWFLFYGSWLMVYGLCLEFMVHCLWQSEGIQYHYRPWFQVYVLYLMPNVLWFKLYGLCFRFKF